MAHINTRSCCNDASCIPVCPVNCIHPTPDEPDFGKTEMLYIDPAGCVDCGACVAACPAAAITHEFDLTAAQEPYRAINALWYEPPGRADYSRTPMPLTAQRWPGGRLRVAIVGSGPAAFYAADELLTQRGLDVAVDMFERLPVPGGLVRFGVAPDHQDTKGASDTFAKTMQRRGLRMFLNTEIGRDLSIRDLTERYDAVIVAVGALQDRALEVPGEDLPGSHSATEFVAWYNGHPDYVDRTYDLSGRHAVIVGNGNVALDVARILTSGPERLARTDIADHALEALTASNIEEVTVIGRRGPAQAAFSAKELLGLVQTPGISVELAEELTLDPVSAESVGGREGSMVHVKLDLLADLSGSIDTDHRKITLRFLAEPIELVGRSAVEGIRLRRTELVATEAGGARAVVTDETEELACDLVFRAIGFRGAPVPGLPFDETRGIIPNRNGVVVDPVSDSAIPGMYVAGWIKRGPSGVIGTNKKCAEETVAQILEDFRAGSLNSPTHDPDDVPDLVPHSISAAGWHRIDEHERAAGRANRRPRVKIVNVGDMLGVALPQI
ncbi:FAD-dependent oxidoreductase [Rhodococcus sp. NPDC057529]|uniref:FAD-dependent oxidoreductase n=1 Tax=Rhodococcus sp. NPDC057529 TaxID=3346158 RepID=UPI00366F95A1